MITRNGQLYAFNDGHNKLTVFFSKEDPLCVYTAGVPGYGIVSVMVGMCKIWQGACVVEACWENAENILEWARNRLLKDSTAPLPWGFHELLAEEGKGQSEN